MKVAKCFLICFLLAGCVAAESNHQASTRPNVLFIAMDDLRDWVGYLGGYTGKAYTPNLDRLSEQGTAFTNAHTAAPLCSPSRTAVLTGRLPSSTGIYGNSQWLKPHRPDLLTLPLYFRQQGYVTVGAGKIFHHTAGNNPPLQWNSFQRLLFKDDAWTRVSDRWKKLYPWTQPQPVPEGFPFSGLELYSPEVDWGVLPKPEAEFDDAETMSFALEFLSEEHERPFFLAAGTFRPHLPWYIPRKYYELYEEDPISLPEVPSDDLDDIPEAGLELAERKREDLSKVIEHGAWEDAVRHYLASISFADAQVGRLLDGLQASRYAENTIIVLWSDHGWHLGEKGHWHKRTLWEVATRVPLIIKAPGRGQAGQRSSRAVSLVDLFPTLIDLCDLPPVQGLDGESLKPLLENPKAARLRPAVIEEENGHCAVRDDRFRYIRYQDGGEELYDHQTDPNEWSNLSKEPSMAETKSRLASWIPKVWAEAAPKTQAYDFDPETYSWTVKKTGETISGLK